MFSYSIFQTRATGSNVYETRNGVAASSTNTYYSDSWRGEQDWGLSVQTSGDLTGTWTLWATDKLHPSLADDTDWVDMSSHAEFVETNPAGTATKWRVNSTTLRAGQFRLKYVNTSGTGTLTAQVTPSKD